MEWGEGKRGGICWKKWKELFYNKLEEGWVFEIWFYLLFPYWLRKVGDLFKILILVLARALKAKYHPYCDFLDTPPGG